MLYHPLVPNTRTANKANFGLIRPRFFLPSSHVRSRKNRLLNAHPLLLLIHLQPRVLSRNPPEKAQHLHRAMQQRLGRNPTDRSLVLTQIAIQHGSTVVELAWARTLLSRGIEWLIEPLDKVCTVGGWAGAEDGSDGTDGLIVQALAGWLVVG